jgi:hypothetical protein
MAYETGGIMNLVRWSSILAIICAGIFGCESALYILLINHLDVPLSISVGRHTVSLGPGQSVKLLYPSTQSPDYGMLRITVRECDLSYRMPNRYPEFPSPTVKGIIPLQIDPDLKLYAMLPGSTAVSNTYVDFSRSGIFPLAALKRECHS